MKKLLFVLFVVLLPFGAFAQVSLNNYTFDVAYKMSVNFLHHNDNFTDKKIHVWFPSKVINDMVDLLNRENGKLHKDVSGIRVYYGMDANNKNTVILVSTYDSVSTVTHNNLHQDYF